MPSSGSSSPQRPFNNTMQGLSCLLVASLLCLSGCSKAPDSSAGSAAPVAAAAADASAQNQADMPPSFLDEPPPAPTSDSYVLSGGTLIGSEDLFDAVVVVEKDRVIAAGKRGEVPVPPDSIGIDASGKFIVADDPETTLIGGPANLTVYDTHPHQNDGASVFANVVNGEWQLR